ncbi:MAG: hypothetical protein KC448_12905 [Yoonia sp.]|nr:hypothetical protein [Yoonia sp.]
MLTGPSVQCEKLAVQGFGQSFGGAFRMTGQREIHDCGIGILFHPDAAFALVPVLQRRDA